MKLFGSLFLAIALLMGAMFSTVAQASVVGMTPYSKVIYISAAVTSSAKSLKNSGVDYSSPKGFFDGDLLAIPANVIITNVYVICDESVTGPTAFNLGDDDAASGFVASSSPSFSAGAKYYWEITDKGTYLKSGTTLLSKYYGATGKELKLDVTGTASTGKLRVFVQGFAVGKAQ